MKSTRIIDTDVLTVRRLLVVVAVIATLVAPGARGAGARADWTIVPSPDPSSTSNRLRGVSGTASDDVWAVGSYANGAVVPNLALHWDGASWRVVPVPKPLGGSFDGLNDVAAVAKNDAWAVGGQWFSYSLRWDGLGWSQVPLGPFESHGFPNANYTLYDLAVATPGDVWTVGDIDAMNGGPATIAVHWNGSRWARVPTPNQPHPDGSGEYSSELRGVAARAANDVWAVGHYRVGGASLHPLVEHWDGVEWSIVPSPDGPAGSGISILSAVAVGGANDVWAVGEYAKPSAHTFGKGMAMHWNGSQWSVYTLPQPSPWGVNPLTSVAIVGPNDVWAAGSWQNATQGLSTFVVHWDGTVWSQVPSPDQPGDGTGWNELMRIASIPGGDLWAVGHGQSSFDASLATTLTMRAAQGDPPVKDTVRVSAATYRATSKRLQVKATSTSATATLRAYDEDSGALLGALINRGDGRYTAVFVLPTAPRAVRVASSLGGTATRTVRIKG